MRAIVVVALALGLGACRMLDIASDDYAREIASAVELHVEREEFSQAGALLDEALADAPDDAKLHFVHAWFHSVIAARPDTDTKAELIAAEREYAYAVELDNTFRAAILNWSLVLNQLEVLGVPDRRSDGTTALATIERITEIEPFDALTYDALLARGDILSRLEKPHEALASYARAEERRPSRVPARRRRTTLLMALFDADPDGGWTPQLWAACEQDLAEGFDEVAAMGYQFLVARRVEDADRALCLWLVARARVGALSRFDLPVAAIQACDATRELLPTLEKLCTDVDPVALAEELVERDDPWLASRPRAYAIVLALQAAARELSLRAAPHAGEALTAEQLQQLREATRILVACVRGGLAPPAPHEPRRDYPEQDAVLEATLGERIATLRLDTALDLLLLYYNYGGAGELRFDDEGEDRLWELLQDAPLNRYATRWSELKSDVEATGKDLVRIHTILGLVYADAVDWKSMAQIHLERARHESRRQWDELRARDDGGRAYEIARSRAEASGVAISEEQPLPHIAQRIGAGLTAALDPKRGEDDTFHWGGGPGGALLSAAEGYLDAGAPDKAYALHDQARVPRDLANEQFHDLEQLLFAKYGWYLGLSTGYAIGGSAKDLRQTLELQGHVIDSLTLSDPQAGLRVAGGYRFRGSWAVEFAYVDLGEYQSDVMTSSPVTEVARALEREHPLTGVGVSAMLKNFVYDRDRLGVYAKAGLWLWEADLEVAEVNGTSVRLDEAGVDPVIGVGVQYRIGPRVHVRGEFERYYLDDDEVDFLTIGLQFNLSRR